MPLHATRCPGDLAPAVGAHPIVVLGSGLPGLHVAPEFLLPGQRLTVVGPPPLNIPDPIPMLDVQGILCQVGDTTKPAGGSRTVFAAQRPGTVMVGVSDYHGGGTASFALDVCVVVQLPGTPPAPSACK